MNALNEWIRATPFMGVILSYFLVSLSASESGAPVPEQPASELPRVLIIGDSISIGYTPFLAKSLEKKAIVQHHKGNAEHTETGLKRLSSWLGDTHWEIIQFNWGLWDLCYRHPDSKVQGHRDKERGALTISLDQYGKNLEQLVVQLKKTGAKLIWANTTIIPEGEAGRILGDDLRYNEVAAKIMNRNDIAITDLNVVSRSFPPSLFTQPGNVHFTKDGYRQLAAQAQKGIESVLVQHAGNQ